jgi:leucyl-tRNA---protein transferase
MPSVLSCFPEEGFMDPILENAEAAELSSSKLDELLAMGWRHFGTKFFRYNFALHEGVLCGVLPLRIRIESFAMTKNQRRVSRRNEDVESSFGPASHHAAYDDLFDRHKTRFAKNVPDSLRDFLSDNPAEIPCTTLALEVRLATRLLAVSFMDVGAESTSSVYAAFDPEHASRSLGIFTLLKEIEHAGRMGKKFYYLGYAYTVPSVYDYKKVFPAVEPYDWERTWVPLPRDYVWSRKIDMIRKTSA